MEPSTDKGKRVRVLTQSVPNVEVFDFAGAEGDTDAIASLWDAWVSELYTRGFEPAEEPLRWTASTVTYRVFPVDLINEYEDDRIAQVPA